MEFFLILLYFIREHKENLIIKRYLELEHNYFELTEDGRLDDNKPHWPEVMEGFEKLVDKTVVNRIVLKIEITRCVSNMGLM